jgi:hypothetical protein
MHLLRKDINALIRFKKKKMFVTIDVTFFESKPFFFFFFATHLQGKTQVKIQTCLK